MEDNVETTTTTEIDSTPVNQKRNFSDESKQFRSLTKKEKYEKLLDFCKQNNRTPSVNRVPESERILGQFMINSKSAINRGTYEEWEVQYMADVVKFSCNRESRLDKINRILAFCVANNKTPSQSSKSIDEKRLGQLLNTMKNLNGQGKLTADEIEVMTKIDEYKSNYQRSRDEKLVDVLKFCEIHDRTPRQHVADEEEKRMAEFLSTTKILAKNNKLDEKCSKLLESILEYAPVSRTEKLNELLNFVKEHNQSPKMNSDNQTERRLATFLTKMNTLLKTNSLDDAEAKLLTEARNICNIKTREQKLTELLDYATEFNRLPRLNSDDQDERKLAMFYNNTTQSFKNNKLKEHEAELFNKIREFSQKPVTATV